MKVTVLGATGFLGSWATRALLADGHQVQAIVRPGSRTWRIDTLPGLEISRVSPDEWPAELANHPPESLLSLDWDGVTAAQRQDDHLQLANLSRQAALHAAALSAGTARIVGVGSQAEFGPVDGRIDDDRTPAPTTAYGRAKTMAREALETASEAAGAQHVWARVFSVFGPLETGPWLLPSISRAAATNQPFDLSSASQPWSYLFAADAGRALATLAIHPRASGSINVGHPEAPPLRESAELFAAARGAELRFGSMPGIGIQPGVDRLIRLGWAPQWQSDRAFDTTAAWLRGEPVPDPLVTGQQLPLER